MYTVDISGACFVYQFMMRDTFFVLKTTASEINDLNLSVRRVRKQDILWLQIAMNDSMALEKNQRAEHLFRKPTNELERKSAEIVALDKLIEVHP